MSTTANILGHLLEDLVARIDPDQVLGRMGLERRRSAVASLAGPAAALGAGIAAGAYADDVLVGLGFRRARSAAPGILAGIGILATGAIVGAGVGLALAPTSGRELRQRAAQRIGALKEQLLESASIPTAKAQAAAHNHAA